MTTSVAVGRATGGKPINLAQLQQELLAGGVDVSATGLGMTDELVHTYSPDGTAGDFATAQQAVVDQAIADHVALRAKTDEEYAEEFQDPTTTAARKQEIRDITAGLLPREQVPMDPTKGVPEGRSAPPEPSSAHAQIAAATDLEQLKNALLEAIP